MAPILPERTRRALQRLDERAMPDRCTLRRPGATPDGRGGQRAGQVTLAADVPCRVTAGGQQSTSGQITMIGDKSTLIAPWIVEIPLATALSFNGQATVLRPGDQVVVGSKAYEVIAPLAGQSYATSFQIGCKEVL